MTATTLKTSTHPLEVMNNLKLLIKFPTRSRPEKFFSVLEKYRTFQATDNVQYVVSCDIDDTTMNNENVIDKLTSYNDLDFYFSKNTSKVQACNADLSNKSFDIILLASDDMIPVKYGYDAFIKNSMESLYPDLDGVLWFSDGFQGKNLNTLSILGKKYYNRFGYIYNPEYKSLYCDQEFTQVSLMLNKTTYIDTCIIKHEQYSIINEEPDELYVKNDSLQNIDLEVFKKRAARNFNL